MKTVTLFFFIFLNISILSAQNTAPEVSNVTFSQRTDGSFMVDVYYDVNDADGDVMTVTMEASNDAGATWNFSSNSTSGDAGPAILSGTGKHIVWDFGTEHPQTYSDQIQIKIIADDNYSGEVTGTMTDIDGNVYKTVKIGNQWWMAENLKVTRYRNGEVIPNVTGNTAWVNLSTGARCSYNNNDANVTTYGLLYNWYAVADSRDIAPAGWHVPTDEEWQTAVDYRGGSSLAGGKMKSTGTIEGGDGLWSTPNRGATNESGFTALPGGLRTSYSGFPINMGTQGNWWSATESGSMSAWYRSLSYFFSAVYRYDEDSQAGYSVRCIRD